jgi:thiamine biosynthesis lipoprotein
LLDVLTTMTGSHVGAAFEIGADVARATFRAMGTEISLVGPSGIPSFPRLAADVQALFERLESRLSRFRDSSELSRVNRTAGHWITVSEAFAALLELALDGARRSEGLFDPTVLPALVAAGYDRDFREVRRRHAGRAVRAPRDPAPLMLPAGRWSDVRLEGDRLLLPHGTALDFGGIGKGWAADLACSLVAGELPWAVVDAGGDLILAGSPPAGGVDVAIDDPEIPGAPVLGVRVEAGALATSSVTFRRWSRDRRWFHHIIDPRTGTPAVTGVLQATAWAPDCAEAEVRAKWALLAGPAVVDRLPVALFLDDGRVLVSLGAFRPAGPRHEVATAAWTSAHQIAPGG